MAQVHAGRSGVLALILGDAANTGIGFLTAALVVAGSRTSTATEVSWIVLPALAICVQLMLGAAAGLYSGRWRPCSLDEALGIGGVVLVALPVLILLDVIFGEPIGIGVAVTGALFTLVTMGGTRCLRQAWRDRQLRPSRNVRHRVVILGAGDAGDQVVHAMMRNPDSEYLPLALLDDDPRKSNLRIMGVPVVGDRKQLTEAARAYNADTVLVAIPGMSSSLVREVSQQAAAARLALKVLPPVSELPEGVVHLTDVRPIAPRDMLGRREVDIDIDQVAGYLSGRRVLVTGAGGSIGSELCRQLARFGPERLILLDRDESALHAVQLLLSGRALLDDRSVVVADIRDRNRLEDVFDEHQPEVVFHTAALKHLPLLELHPAEALKTNVWGTANVLDVAAGHGVARFVNISTDKAADPTSVLGWSKRLGERLTAAVGAQTERPYLSVRFGNVLGSRGSVLHAFQAQIDGGGPLTVTHPEVTRYFMTVEEAVRLVVQSGAIGGRGEVLVLDMGTPVRIADVAEQMIDASGRDIRIVYTGLRPGEKLHEVLFGADEHDVRPVHPLVSHVGVPPLSTASLPSPNRPVTDLLALAEMRRLCAVPAPAQSAASAEAVLAGA